MATGITIPFPKDLAFGTPTVFQEFSLADQTGNVTAQTLAANCRFFFAYVSVKSYTVGNATVGPIFKLRASSAAAMNASLIILDQFTMDNTATATETQSVILFGMTPLAAGLGFCDVTVTLSGNSSISYDCVIDVV